ncbi:S-adenosylmethionine:tRNA ribosyltransferase-isomerase [soil metagenome]
MHPKDLVIQDFTYDLPDERVAKYPLASRDESKLLLYKKGDICETIFSNIATELPEGCLLVFNDSKVVEARLLFKKKSGGIIEIFALEPHEQYADITTAMNTNGSIQYKCLVGGAGKWKRGMVLTKEVLHNESIIHIEATITERRADCFIIELKWTPADLPYAEILHAAGNIPIPPYLHRDADDSDTERYQTIYALADGSVAAPTAGLHFTPQSMQSLSAKNIEQAYVTLHVGAGTFMPVKSATMQDHNMHAEFIDVSIDLLKKLIVHNTIIPVGTTSMRTIESLYWMGFKALINPVITLQDICIEQWDPYEAIDAGSIFKVNTVKNVNTIEHAINGDASAPNALSVIDKKTALQALIQWLESHKMQRLIVKTQILIAPGYQFKIANALITNFHQPESTLLLLVSALIGDDWKKVYSYAMANDFRFLSYGDSSLLFPIVSSR